MSSSSFPSVAICLLAQSNEAINGYDGDVVWSKLKICFTLFTSTLSEFTWSNDIWVIAPIILCVLWVQISAPQSTADIGKSSWKCKWGPWASSTINGIS